MTGTLHSRRQALALLGGGLGGLATRFLSARQARAQARRGGSEPSGKAKRAIWLFMAGAPSQLDLLDHKPGLRERFDQDLPDSVRQGQRLTGMTSSQTRFPIAPSRFEFAQHGESGTWVSELLPWTARVADELAVVRSLYTESINHEPAMLHISTGTEREGRPSVGSWLSYGLGGMAENLPTFAVMTSKFSSRANVQAISSRLWGSGFLPSVHSGVVVRGTDQPVLYVDDPAGVQRVVRREMLDTVNALNRIADQRHDERSIRDRIDQYEMAFRMQSAVPELVDMSGESAARKLYGDAVSEPGTFAANCLLARRMVERGVRFVQIYHRGWDAHFNLPENHRLQAADVDRACYGLITDLKQRGLLEDTLVLWGGEFGRTVYCQGDLTKEDYGRDHHPRCFSMWLAGGGIKPGVVHGETDDFSYNIVQDPVHLRDLHATILHQFGLDHETLSVDNGGLQERLVGVSPPARVVTELLR